MGEPFVPYDDVWEEMQKRGVEIQALQTKLKEAEEKLSQSKKAGIDIISGLETKLSQYRELGEAVREWRKGCPDSILDQPAALDPAAHTLLTIPIPEEADNEDKG